MNCPHCNKPLKWASFINWSSQHDCPHCHSKLHYKADIIATILAVLVGLVLRKLLMPISTILTFDLVEVLKTLMVVMISMIVIQISGMALGLGTIEIRKK